ncbi:MAG: LSU ribosomal protein L24E [halophilic archaeon J07HX64]|jgi:LSU ribosomal protein L24E|nr:MAG: LSU ribosomal protein L24E [halophilic archaeon J07HX64]
MARHTCDYTGEDIEPGTGKMFVQTDGTILWFKDSKAEKNYFLGRESRDLEWIHDDEGDEETGAGV